MNKIDINIKPTPKVQPGDFFAHDSGDIYILSVCATESDAKEGKELYVAICLQDGFYWAYPDVNINGAVNGLRFLGRDMKMVIHS